MAVEATNRQSRSRRWRPVPRHARRVAMARKAWIELGAPCQRHGRESTAPSSSESAIDHAQATGEGDALDECVDTLYLGDSIKLLSRLPDDSIDFVVSSPPYADNRKSTYQGIPVDQYVEWFTPYTGEILRLLKPDGSFVLNIKERAENLHRQRLHRAGQARLREARAT